MGTIGARFNHPDTDLVARSQEAAATTAAQLQHADRTVRTALPHP
jgi:hypothetical protein